MNKTMGLDRERREFAKFYALFEDAYNRLAAVPKFHKHIDVILSDKPEMNKHLEWVIDASDEDIQKWITDNV